MSRRRSSAPTALRLLSRLTGTPRARRRGSARSGHGTGRSLYVSGPSSRVRGSRNASLFARHRAAIGLAAFLVFLGAVNLYVLYYRHDTSVPALLELASAGRRAAIGTHPGTRLLGPPGTPPVPSRSLRRSRSLAALPDYPRIVEVALKIGDSVPSVLRGHGITGPLADELQSVLRPLLDPGGLGPGQTFSFYYDGEDRLAALDYRLTDSSAFHLERVATGSAERFVSTRQEQQLTRQVTALSVTLDRDGDLVAALTRLGEQPALAARLAEVFACETSAYTDAKAGDRFRLVVEKVLLGGSLYRYGRLLAAEYQPAAPAHAEHPPAPRRAFLSPTVTQPSAGAASGAAGLYFNEAGDSLARALCRAPLLYGKTPGGLTDPAALRPLVHAERGRASIDYPAGAGTPVVAAGAGKVTFAGTRTPGGLTVVLSHPGGAETTYQNLGRLARGLTEGQPVKLRQVIGSVAQPSQSGRGRTARPAAPAAKPHLHFVLRVGNKQVDASKWRSPREPALAASQRSNFTNQVTDLMEKLAQEGGAPALAPPVDTVASRPPSPANP